MAQKNARPAMIEGPPPAADLKASHSSHQIQNRQQPIIFHSQPSSTLHVAVRDFMDLVQSLTGFTGHNPHSYGGAAEKPMSEAPDRLPRFPCGPEIPLSPPETPFFYSTLSMMEIVNNIPDFCDIDNEALF